MEKSGELWLGLAGEYWMGVLWGRLVTSPVLKTLGTNMSQWSGHLSLKRATIESRIELYYLPGKPCPIMPVTIR